MRWEILWRAQRPPHTAPRLPGPARGPRSVERRASPAVIAGFAGAGSTAVSWSGSEDQASGGRGGTASRSPRAGF